MYQLTESDKNAMALARVEFRHSFMNPAYYRGSDIPEIIMHEGLDLEDDGIYTRLTANGYMDQTDLSGPYATAQEAAEALIEMYAED